MAILGQVITPVVRMLHSTVADGMFLTVQNRRGWFCKERDAARNTNMIYAHCGLISNMSYPQGVFST